MARHYHHDLARWEGEGGAPAEHPALQSAGYWVDTGGRSTRDGALWGIVIGVAIVMGSALYARQKGWI